MRIKNSSELQIGKIVYTVYGINRTKTEVDEKNITKMIILSKPKMIQLGKIGGLEGYPSPFIDVEVMLDDGSSYKTDHSLHDAGIMDLVPGSKVHNLNRWFSHKEDALQFMEELANDEFSDPDDADYAERNPAQLDLDRRMEALGMWLEDMYWNDYDSAGDDE